MVRKTALAAVALGVAAYAVFLNSNGESIEITPGEDARA
jgi:hypothetical protein